jgi:predicted helicase
MIFPDKNIALCISGNSLSKPFQILASKYISGLDFLEKTQCLPLYRYDKDGNRIDNITDWGLEQFAVHYPDKGLKPLVAAHYPKPLVAAHYPDKGLKPLVKEDIFHYVYAVLHNPAYRQKYELNLKREFPRIPFYEDFHQWAAWGKRLIDLHINYESKKPYPLQVMATDVKPLPNSKLKADKEAGVIVWDDNTELTGIPVEAWDYKLGNRSALEWILDQYKEQVIDLLKRVCSVSVETMTIVDEMKNK